MLTLQLDSYAADKALLSTNQLSFVELAAPEAKVSRKQCGVKSSNVIISSPHMPIVLARPVPESYGHGLTFPSGLTTSCCMLLQDPLGIGRQSNSDNANARSLAMAYNSLSKVLTALRHSAPAAATAQAFSATAAALAIGGLGQQQLQHVPWRDSPLTRWLQERLHAASAITLLGTVSASTEVSSYSY